MATTVSCPLTLHQQRTPVSAEPIRCRLRIGPSTLTQGTRPIKWTGRLCSSDWSQPVNGARAPWAWPEMAMLQWDPLSSTHRPSATSGRHSPIYSLSSGTSSNFPRRVPDELGRPHSDLNEGPCGRMISEARPLSPSSPCRPPTISTTSRCSSRPSPHLSDAALRRETLHPMCPSAVHRPSPPTTRATPPQRTGQPSRALAAPSVLPRRLRPSHPRPRTLARASHP